MLLLFLLACAPTVAPPEPEADPSRIARPSRPRAPIHPPGSRFWTLETASGECTTRDADGAVVARRTVNAEGAPVRSVAADGTAHQWFRRRDARGVLRSAWLYRYAPGAQQGDLVGGERYDQDGRLVWRSTGPHSVEEWDYDAAGRIVRTYAVRADVYEDTYAYSADGLLEAHAYDTGWGYGTEQWLWRDGQLVSWTQHDVWSEFAELRWTSHHASGLPEHGEGATALSIGTSGAWVEDWSYDDEGHPTAWSSGGAREVWAWEGDRVVLYERYGLSRDGVEVREDHEAWAWDDQGRIVAHEDGRGLQTWAWAADGDVAAYANGDQSWTFEGDCRTVSKGLPAPPAPGPLPRPPEPPRHWTE